MSDLEKVHEFVRVYFVKICRPQVLQGLSNHSFVFMLYSILHHTVHRRDKLSSLCADSNFGCQLRASEAFLLLRH